MAAGAFLSDVRTLRERARRHIEQGAVTPSYKADVQTVVKLLNQALATEIVCVLRYKRHYYMATGINAPQAQQEFLQHANDEQMHADQIAARIVQLGGEPNFSPEGLASRSHAEYVEGESLPKRNTRRTWLASLLKWGKSLIHLLRPASMLRKNSSVR